LKVKVGQTSQHEWQLIVTYVTVCTVESSTWAVHRERFTVVLHITSVNVITGHRTFKISALCFPILMHRAVEKHLTYLSAVYSVKPYVE